MKEKLKQYLDNPVAVMCIRYWFRGILKEVGEDYIVISNPYAVITTGKSSGKQPETEDAIPSDLFISMATIEIVCQPAWCFYGYGKEAGK